MGDRSVDGALRLRGAGVGSIAGGVLLGVLTLLGVPFLAAAAIVLGAGAMMWVGERHAAGRYDARPSIGIAAIGGIGLLEAGGSGIGVGPLLLAGLAVGAGLVDILIGLLFSSLKRRGGEGS